MSTTAFHRIRVIDSHTAGEPTRVVLEGGPDLGAGSPAERCARFRATFDRFRSAIVMEPRGSDPLVGALLLDTDDPRCIAGVIFFNNVGYLGMCGHGTIGLVASLAHLGRIGPGIHRIATPVGTVAATLHEDGDVSVENVQSYRFRKDVVVQVPDRGGVRGDVAWGGNWFFIVRDPEFRIEAGRAPGLAAAAADIRRALAAEGITGEGGAEIDHIELSGAPCAPDADSRNFVLCPGGAYDRSPCGTGTSAKLACLVEDGVLREGGVWHQEGLAGGVFTATFRREGTRITPTIRGRAHVTAEAVLLLDPTDPLRWGPGRMP